jgi:hypothetical protein
MDVVTGRYVRADGTRAKRYECVDHRQHARGHSCYCPAQAIDAAVVDAAVINNLTKFLGDVDGWRERLVSDRAAERTRMTGEVERATAALADEERRVQRQSEQWERWLDAGDDTKADAVLEVLERRRADRDRARIRLQAATDAYTTAGATTDEPVDAMLDFYNALRKELAGRVEGAGGNVKRLNACLRDYFERVELRETDGGCIVIRPVLSDEATARIVGNTDTDYLMLSARRPPVRPIATTGAPVTNPRSPS